LGYDQLRLVDVPLPDKAINVAAVRQRSPFRYPGGKTWLVPYVQAWFAATDVKPHVLIEPFAGGAIIGLTVAFEALAEKVVLVELDEHVAGVWQVILGGGAQWLADRILSFAMSQEAVAEELSKTPASLNEIAFQTLLRNRVNHGGILAPGSGILKYGENGRGVASRWYPETLSARITAIDSIKSRIEFIPGDGLQVMRSHTADRDVVFFIDPPYTAAGKRAGRRLYTHHELDHEALFAVTAELQGDFLMTYDDAEEVRALALKHGFDFRLVPMTNTHHAEMKELLIARDMTWMDRYRAIWAGACAIGHNKR